MVAQALHTPARWREEPRPPKCPQYPEGLTEGAHRGDVRKQHVGSLDPRLHRTSGSVFQSRKDKCNLSKVSESSRGRRAETGQHVDTGSMPGRRRTPSRPPQPRAATQTRAERARENRPYSDHDFNPK